MRDRSSVREGKSSGGPAAPRMLGARDAGRCPPKGRTSLLVLYYDSRAIPVVVSQRECAAAARLAPVAVAPAFARGAPKAA
ncbi:hypothetical protein ACX841_33590, partial [Burkholderia pseudomallei]